MTVKSWIINAKLCTFKWWQFIDQLLELEKKEKKKKTCSVGIWNWSKMITQKKIFKWKLEEFITIESRARKKNRLIKNLKNLTFKCLYNIFHQWGKKLLEKCLNFFIALVRTISQKLYLLHKKSKKLNIHLFCFFSEFCSI